MYKVNGVAVVGANEHGEKSGLENQLRRGNRKEKAKQTGMWQGGNPSF
jgi:hypothetical protein